MRASNAERLSSLDAAFVKLDRLRAPYVVGSVMLYERKPLTTPSGQLDQDRLREYIAAKIDRLPRYRQRLGKVPFLRHPAWVDDPKLDLHRHVRFITLPSPASPEKLDALSGDILSQKLDPAHPRWELWIIDPVGDDMFAMVAKVHHSLVDGVAGVRLMQEMLRLAPDGTMPAREPWTPRSPSPLALLRDEIAYRVSGLRSLRKRIPGDPRKLFPALGKLVQRALRPASDAGVNPQWIGRRRAIARLQFPMADVIRAKRRHAVTVNDVVLAAIAGGVRRFLVERGVDVSRLDDFRAMVPASTHETGSTTVSGNRVALMLARLPLDEADPIRRVQRVHEMTSELKTRADEVAAGELLVQLSDVTIPSLLPFILGLSLVQRGFNVAVTNIPGPPVPLYLLGSRLASYYPIINLWPRQTFGLALLSYNGVLHVGIDVDPDAVPDLERLVRDLEGSFQELFAPERPAEAPAVKSPNGVAGAAPRL